MNRTVILVGCGKMGSALLQGWSDSQKEPKRIVIIEPNIQPHTNIAKLFKDNFVKSPSELPFDIDPSVILFAVKPQIMDEVVPNFQKYCSPNTLIVSIAAGKSLQYFTRALGGNTPVVRAMPNTPAAIGRGITVACPNENVSRTQRQIANTLLSSTGQIKWVQNEKMLDSVTALSGGGPAYVFLLVECLAKAGVEMGLPKQLSNHLARATVSGAGELLHLSSEEPNSLRKNVTSPGGTTEEALKVLMEGNQLQSLITEALKAAKEKSKKLAN